MFEGNCDLARMNVQYTDIANRVLVDQRDVRRVERKLSKLRCEIKEFKNVFQKVSALQCTAGLYSLNLDLPDHLVKDL